MSCGPSSAMRDLADQIDQANDALDAAINDSPLGKLVSLATINIRSCDSDNKSS